MTTFSEVLAEPIGTLIRRRGWPVHWWVEIVEEFGTRTMKHMAITDGPGPFGETTIFHSFWLRQLPLAEAAATDWHVIDAPPFKVISGTLAAVPHFDCALLIAGRLVPVESLPDLPGHRIEVLVPELPE